MKDTIFVQPDEEGKLSKFKIGDDEFTQDDILNWKNGHMMQSDYTKKTQDLAREKQELERQKQELVQSKFTQPSQPQMGQQPDYLVKQVAKLELEVKLERLKSRYPDFNEMAVLDKAHDMLNKGLPVTLLNYEEIWLAMKPTPNQADLKEQIRKEIMKEMEPNTDSIIGGTSTPSPTTSKLTPEELDICAKLNITPEEYIKYK